MSDVKKPIEVRELWTEIRLLMESLDKDLEKNLNKIWSFQSDLDSKKSS